VKLTAEQIAEIRRLFPAKFTDSILDTIEAEIRARMLGVGVVWDPCVGVGGVHALADRMPGLVTLGMDIEEEFAACHERSVWGDSTAVGVPGSTARRRAEKLLDGRKLNAVVTSFAYGNRLCLAAGSLVTTWEGPTPIEDVQPGTLVLTHRGRWRRVTWAGSKGVKPVVKVDGVGAGPLTCTPDHRVWSHVSAFDVDRSDHGEDWRRADELVGTHWATPLRGVQHYWGAVRSVTAAGEVEVFDLEVEDDHSFVANGIAVHNSDGYLGSDNEKCRKCLGRGWVPTKEWAKANPDVDVDEHPPTLTEDRVECSNCEGSGKAKSKRQGYVFAKGSKLTTGSGAAVAFGPKYMSIHQRIMDGTARFADEHRDHSQPFWWFINVSSFIRDDDYVGVMEWWVGEIARRATIVDLRPVDTPRHGMGANADKRVPAEHLIIAKS
jgi:hypothetical protein